MKVLTPDEMRRMDETCIRQYGIPAQILMENAASSALQLILSKYPCKSILTVCGSGNNGGDGLALARKLHSAGRDVRVVIQGNIEKFSAETSLNYRIVNESYNFV